MSERERFEVWAGRHMLASTTRVMSGSYQDLHTSDLWQAWQARARIESERERELVEALRDLLPDHDAGLSLEHNQHKNVYDTAEQWIVDNDWCDWESDEAKRQAIEADSIWTLQWYPDTPVGFYAVAAPTLADLLRLAREDKADEM